ncbi:hypothetical protein AVEN_22832-1, partial [Araneus ventricosus]
TREALTLLL